MSLWINDKGQAVGTSGTCANTGLLPLGHGAHPVLWDTDGAPLDLGRTNPSWEFGGIALAINNAGQVVGAATPPDGSLVAFLRSRQRGARKLLPLRGPLQAAPCRLTIRAMPLASRSTRGRSKPVIWRNGRDPKNLNDLAPGSPLFSVVADGDQCARRDFRLRRHGRGRPPRLSRDSERRGVDSAESAGPTPRPAGRLSTKVSDPSAKPIRSSWPVDTNMASEGQ